MSNYFATLFKCFNSRLAEGNFWRGKVIPEHDTVFVVNLPFSKAKHLLIDLYLVSLHFCIFYNRLSDRLIKVLRLVKFKYSRLNTFQQSELFCKSFQNNIPISRVGDKNSKIKLSNLKSRRQLWPKKSFWIW